MEITVHTLSDVSREIEIRADEADLRPHLEKAYNDFRPKIEVKGFRKGKVPMEMIKKIYGDAIEQDSLQDIATEIYRNVVKEKDLKPIGDPALVDMNYKKGESLSFRIKYDVRPKIELKEYKSVPVEKVVHRVTDEEVEDEILRLRRMNATTENVQAATDSEHIVVVEMQELDEAGVPLIGKKRENVRFYLADEELEEPFKQALKTASVGGEYIVRFEHQHGDHSHKVHSKLTAKKVEKVSLPPLDDAFVSKITKEKTKTVEAFREGLRADLIAYWETKMQRQVVNSLTAELLRRHDFQVPESLVRSVLEGLLEEVRNEYPGKQLPENFDVNKFNEQNRAYAIAQSKWVLLREELIKAEKVEATDEDLRKLADEESSKIKIDKERLINYYKTSEQIRERIVGDKLVRMLVDSAKIKEVEERKAK
ncbi:MAG TPA: trigger factor [Bacteroidota bacterium]|nr:trigger factor [Bacteroidota bacterium]